MEGEHPLLAKAIGAGVVATLSLGVVLALTMAFLLAGTFFKNTGALGEHELEIKNEGLFERTEANETLSRWSAFHKVFATRRALYIFVTDTTFHAIPRRFFSTPEHMRDFQSEIQRRVTEAKTSHLKR